jgi:hypothetical protein
LTGSSQNIASNSKSSLFCSSSSESTTNKDADDSSRSLCTKRKINSIDDSQITSFLKRKKLPLVTCSQTMSNPSMLASSSNDLSLLSLQIRKPGRRLSSPQSRLNDQVMQKHIHISVDSDSIHKHHHPERSLSESMVKHMSPYHNNTLRTPPSNAIDSIESINKPQEQQPSTASQTMIRGSDSSLSSMSCCSMITVDIL